MPSRSWSHLVRVHKLDGTHAAIYCVQDRGVLRAVGDVDTAPGQRVAVRKGPKWECCLSWAKSQCSVQKRRLREHAPTRLVCWKREGNRCEPWLLVVTEDDAHVEPLRFEQLRDKGLIFPAREAPYKRMASLTPEERKAYHARKGREALLNAIGLAEGTIMRAAVERALVWAEEARHA